MNRNVLRGDIWWLDWSPGRGSEQTGRRPAVVVQTDVANRHLTYPNTIIVAVSRKARLLSFHVRVAPTETNGLRDVSYVKCEQMLTISKERLLSRLGRLGDDDLRRVDAALGLVLGI
ncbi:MAG: type II toxin-antitoxin system PemK/MazF family toxin [Armatimonadota bacterium]|jgi:mRNA interferase MazF